MRLPRLTLRAKLVLAAGGFVLLTQALLLLFMARSVDAEIEIETRQRIDATTSLLNAALAPVVFRRDYAGARDLLEDILRRGAGNLDYIDIVDNRGLPFAQAGVERSGDIPAAGLPLDVKSAVFHGTAPLRIGDQLVGTVRYGLSQRVQLRARNELMIYGISLSALAGLVMIAAFMLIGYFLTRDLQRLLQATRAVTAGDYDIDIRIDSRDEVGDLARHFNSMVEVLR